MSKLGICFCILFFATTSIAQVEKCDSTYQGTQITRDTLSTILKQHARWLEGKGPPLSVCNSDLSGHELSQQNLSQLDLRGSNLSEGRYADTNFSDALLNKAYFRWSKLPRANFTGAQLSNANFEDANLQDADLRQANLSNADLASADLRRANLSGANLTGANLTDTKLDNATLNWTDLTNATLTSATLTNADLAHAILNHADLSESDLTNAILLESNLSHADFTNADLSNADFAQSNLDHAIYHPLTGKLPNVLSLVTAKNFRSIQFGEQQSGPPALAELRAAYKRLGMRTMERTLTAMLKVHAMHEAWKRGGTGTIEAAFSYLFFYITSDFGAAPGRPLRIFLITIFLFMFVYLIPIFRHDRKAAIWITWQTGRFTTEAKKMTQATSDIVSRPIHTQHIEHWAKWPREFLRLLKYTFYFSILSAFHIGWRELNVGNWLTQFQPREYQLRATGWVRAISGIQSVLSVYLIVLWAITYFGRPFDW